MRAKVLRGKRFNKLTVRKRAPKPPNAKSRAQHWVCWCDCGIEVIVRSNNLLSKNTQSCGCGRKKTKKYLKLKKNAKAAQTNKGNDQKVDEQGMEDEESEDLSHQGSQEPHHSL